jgi:hypothetical protein
MPGSYYHQLLPLFPITLTSTSNGDYSTHKAKVLLLLLLLLLGILKKKLAYLSPTFYYMLMFLDLPLRSIIRYLLFKSQLGHYTISLPALFWLLHLRIDSLPPMQHRSHSAMLMELPQIGGRVDPCLWGFQVRQRYPIPLRKQGVPVNEAHQRSRYCLRLEILS